MQEHSRENVVCENNSSLRKQMIYHILIISVIYLLTHGFILFLSGTWWDEKVFVLGTKQQLWDMTVQLGRPTSYYLLSFIMDIPECIGRALIFLLFYFSSLGVYYLATYIPMLNGLDALLIAIVYTVIPANDVRCIRGVFPYTLGHFLFICAFCILVYWLEKQKGKIHLRVISLFLFILSFILNSNLVFYCLPLLYIAYYLVRTRQLRKIFLYFDFALAPFLYFGLKNVLFPTYGLGGGYNEVKLNNIIKSVYSCVFICLARIKDIFYLWKDSYLINWSVIFIIVVFLIVLITAIKKPKLEKADFPKSLIKAIILEVIGAFSLYLGIFPYNVIGQNCTLTGMVGRSAILIPVGAALIVYGLIAWIPSDWVKMSLCCIFLMSGIVHFNTYYLIYQQDYYRQLDLISEFKANKYILADTKNILYITDSEPVIAATRFYTLNECAFRAFGDQTHFVMNGFNDVEYLNNIDEGLYNLNTFVYSNSYGMEDYAIGESNDVQAIIVYNNEFTLSETIRLKWYEISDYNRFLSMIEQEQNMDIYLPSSPEFETIIMDEAS